MKKIKLLCAILLSLTLMGCSSGPAQIKKEGQNTFDGYMNYEILYSELTHRIEPRIVNGYYTYYKPQNTANVMVDLVMKIENISGKELTVKDLKGVFNINDEDYTATKITETDDTTLSTSGTIADKETKIVHMYTEVSMKTNLTKDIKFTLTANEEEAEFSYKINDLKEARDYQQTGYVLKDERAEITLGEIILTDKLDPTNPSMLYQYYKAGDGKTLVALKVSIKNTSQEELSTEKLIGGKVFADSTQYSGGLIAEDENQENLKTSVTIQPGQTHIGYLIGEIDTADAEKAIEVCVYYAGQNVYVKK